jgi:hypothetical protein
MGGARGEAPPPQAPSFSPQRKEKIERERERKREREEEVGVT